ncbi:related to palmitoyl-(protein) hydrolase [Cephalotrichum gorgonifer]|uniref:Palmitoyl-protein thioesterase 1 n=1 Tax=Cephalotrichum gorgonifer TaxID=2041049 RepID=A0AAE8SRP8_9PEZI|nr:related to palmitoyl-(protein) hydrolase [Cephalotrichum gorgonifer]
MRYNTVSHILYASAALAAAGIASPRPSDDDDETPLPLVVWHGLGDSFDGEGMKEVYSLAEHVNPGTFVYPIKLGQDGNSDRTASFYGNVTDQLADVCAALAAHPILSTAPAIDALGFSQGGVFLRGYVERCNNPPVRSLVTFGSPHTGITDFKDCGATDYLCKGAMALLRFNTWSSFVQGRLVPAQYFRDPQDYTSYIEGSNFLADVNNEKDRKNATYAENLASLENLVLYMFEDDTTLIPKESAWFEDVNGTVVTPLRGSKLYSEDWLGLRALDRKGGITFKKTPGEHMQILEGVLREAMESFFGPFGKKFDSRAGSEEL